MNRFMRKRKLYFTQITAVIAACLIVIIGGRILTGNRFEMSIPYGFDQDVMQSEDIQITWEDGREIPVEEVSVRNENETLIVLSPEKPGDYIMHVRNNDGREVFYDELHVSGMLTTYSMQTRNFTGDNAVIAGIDAETGSIEVGKAADMIVVQDNPLDDLSVLRNVSMVIARGNIIRDPKVKRMRSVDELLDRYM